ncbi:MAG: hypothetical protein HYY17_02220 [Planctomycetes bacterium]|nr:hypothetical protein [Planctomycetota bacterium]
MAAKNCQNHPNAPAATACDQCHKPICASCTMVTSMGRFCSSECSIINRETKTKLGPPKKGGGGLRAVLVVLLLVVGAMAAVHFMKKRYPALNKYDVVGRLMGVKP